MRTGTTAAALPSVCCAYIQQNSRYATRGIFTPTVTPVVAPVAHEIVVDIDEAIARDDRTRRIVGLATDNEKRTGHRRRRISVSHSADSDRFDSSAGRTIASINRR